MVAALLCAVTGFVLSPAPAHAAGRSGACTGADANAVTIIVDYQGLGGGTGVYCASNLPAGATGLDALAAVGVAVTGTAHDGLAFVCRVNGRPGPGETITLPNGQPYQEQCVNSPPGGAYWSYWWAKAGGSWGYTSQGAASRQVVFGSYEGWSFSLGGGIGNAPAPRYAPATWEVPQPEPPPTQPAQTAPANQPGNQPANQPANQPGPAAQPAGTGSASSAASAAPSDPGESAVPTPDQSDEPAPGAGSPAVTPSASPSPAIVTDQGPGSPGSGDGSGTNWGLIVGLTALVVLVGAAIVVARLRTRRG